MSGALEPHCIVIPLFGRAASAAKCVAALLRQRTRQTHILLVDDGSDPPVHEHAELRARLSDSRVHVIRHEQNHGIAAARNSAVHWCRENGFEWLIMIDSDCIPSARLIRSHILLQREHPQATVIAGGIVGTGAGIFAHLDGLLSWPNSHPHGAVRAAADCLYHLPMTNVALRLDRLPQRDQLFDERLDTGEDSLLIRELLRHGHSTVFSPQPEVLHHDRETLLGVVMHHLRWGYHQYFVQLGGDFRRPLFHPAYRALFFVAFLLLLPAYAVVGATLNLLPWLRYRPRAALAWLPAIVIWFAKGYGVLRAAANPCSALRQPRPRIDYVCVTDTIPEHIAV